MRLAALILLFSLAGCGSAEQPPATAPAHAGETTVSEATAAPATLMSAVPAVTAVESNEWVLIIDATVKAGLGERLAQVEAGNVVKAVNAALRANPALVQRPSEGLRFAFNLENGARMSVVKYDPAALYDRDLSGLTGGDVYELGD